MLSYIACRLNILLEAGRRNTYALVHPRPTSLDGAKDDQPIEGVGSFFR